MHRLFVSEPFENATQFPLADNFMRPGEKPANRGRYGRIFPQLLMLQKSADLSDLLMSNG